jgi:hypothetical protein
MRVSGVGQLVCHYFFILISVVGWAVPWITPHYYQAHVVRMPVSMMVFEQKVDEGPFLSAEDGEQTNRSEKYCKTHGGFSNDF